MKKALENIVCAAVIAGSLLAGGCRTFTNSGLKNVMGDYRVDPIEKDKTWGEVAALRGNPNEGDGLFLNNDWKHFPAPKSCGKCDDQFLVITVEEPWFPVLQYCNEHNDYAFLALGIPKEDGKVDFRFKGDELILRTPHMMTYPEDYIPIFVYKDIGTFFNPQTELTHIGYIKGFRDDKWKLG